MLVLCFHKLVRSGAVKVRTWIAAVKHPSISKGSN